APEARLDQLHAAHTAVAQDLDRLPVEQEADTFLLAVRHLALRPGHICLVPAVGAGNTGGALPYGRAIAVHTRVTPAEHDDVLPGKVDPRRGRLGQAALDPHLAADVRIEVRQRLVHLGQVFAGQPAAHRRVRTERQEHRIESGE